MGIGLSPLVGQIGYLIAYYGNLAGSAIFSNRDPVCTNVFEIWAGLDDGGYRQC